MREDDRRRILIATAVIGIGLGGFFDGILLHQVLQWHHLLSLVPGEALRDIRTQILADGLFHILMYIVTVVGLWLLWRSRQPLRSSADHRLVLGGALLGFAVWNFLDVIFFHWILGIHRIRIAVPHPMAYDLAWLAAFGALPLLVALALIRRSSGPGIGDGSAAGVLLALVALVSAPLAARPQPNINSAIVFFAPGASVARSLNASRAAGTPLLWVDPQGGLMVVSLDAPDASLRLYQAGALLVTRSPALAGCAAALSA